MSTPEEDDDADREAAELWPAMLQLGRRAALVGCMFTLFVVAVARWSRETPRQSADYLMLAAAVAASPAVLLSPFALSRRDRPLVLLLGCICCGFVGGIVTTSWLVGLAGLTRLP